MPTHKNKKFIGITTENILFKGYKSDMNIETLFDSGASYSFIRRDIAEKLDIIIPLKEELKFETAEIGRNISINEKILLSFVINGVNLSDEFLISPLISEEVIIGAKTMQAWKMHLDFEQEKVLVDKKFSKLILK